MDKSKLKYYCKDCDKPIHWCTALYRGGRCKSCARIEQYRLHPETNPYFGKFGKEHPTFKHGETLKKHYCKDCKVVEIAYTTFKDGEGRCKSCARKHDYKDPSNHPMHGRTGSLCPAFITGETLKIHYCKDCEKIINSHTALYGEGRCSSCAKKAELNYAWIEDRNSLKYPDEFNEILKEKIRNRDNHECQLCNIKEEILEELLSVHHIDYNKQNCNEENLISLCRNCHRKSNGNRDFWFTYFTEIISSLLVS